MESYPCQGHGDAIVTFMDDTTINVPCSSVGMGAIMWYFNKGHDHFTEYIDTSFKTYLLANM